MANTSITLLTEADLHDLYLWVDLIPLSRPKRSISRDFADGCCVAETINYYFPKLVELHNYVPSTSTQNKLNNWNTLNHRVFRKLYFEVPQNEINDIVDCVPGSIERFLRALRTKIAQIQLRQRRYQEALITNEQERGEGSVKKNGEKSVTSAATHRGNLDRPSLQQQQQRQHIPFPSEEDVRTFPCLTSSLHSQVPSMQRTASVKKGRKSGAFTGCDQLKNSSAGYGDFLVNRSASMSNEERQMLSHLTRQLEQAQELLEEKDGTITELQEAVMLLSEKAVQLEGSLKERNSEIQSLKKKIGMLTKKRDK